MFVQLFALHVGTETVANINCVYLHQGGYVLDVCDDVITPKLLTSS